MADILEVKLLWGNYCFDRIFSEALSSSGEILCVWDSNVFLKEQHIISDNFVALYGTWIPNKMKILLISVYAHQSLSVKRLLWNYLSSLITRWNGECLVMGDFNEVRRMEERHLSDHRPILLREVIVDYGATPFRFYHSWLGLLGFDQMVTSTWNSIVLDDSNKMIRFKKKLQILKKEIRAWIVIYNRNQKGHIEEIKSKLKNIDQMVDQGVLADGEWVDDPIRVKQEFCNHFATRFQDPGPTRGCLNFDFPYRLNDEQNSVLESPVTREEIRIAVWACGEDKSPGPDGFTFEFFHLILDVQTAFLPDRQILDGPFIVNDILSRCKAKNQQAMFFKVDFAKAYDSIRWDFLDDVLNSFGFGSKWRSWIRGSLCSGKASILVNGSLTAKFQFHRGGNMSLVKEWDESIAKLKKKPSKWKLKALSVGMSINIHKSHLLGIGVSDVSVFEAANQVSKQVSVAEKFTVSVT
nr:RNA-directed DNA polymerase, eukaryota [Tanacetum cinerariifolium]